MEAILFLCSLTLPHLIHALESTRLSICHEGRLRLDAGLGRVTSLQDPSQLLLSASDTATLTSLGQSARIWPLSSNQSAPNQPVQCVLEIVACSVCKLDLSWPKPPLGSSFPSICTQETDSKTKSCAQLIVQEDGADRSSGRVTPFRRFSILRNRHSHNYTSSSYKLKLIFKTWNLSETERAQLMNIFPLRIVASDNAVVMHGMPANEHVTSLVNSTGFISSPRYPDFYPDGGISNFTLVNDLPSGFIRLIFTDFMLHYMSVLKVLDSNGRELLNTEGEYGGVGGRPPPLQSSGRTLTVLFHANHYTHEIGFKAQYWFVDSALWPEKPVSHDCDKVLELNGGIITIADDKLRVKSYIDCVWVIGKARFFGLLYDGLYLKVEDFRVQSNSKGIQLQIRNGKTSSSPLLMDVWGPQSSVQLARDQPQEGFLISISPDDVLEGMYIRLRGYLDSYDGLKMSWVHYYSWLSAMCSDSNHELHCSNGRCIPDEFKCDGGNHCGDYSDEKGTQCSAVIATGGNHKRNSVKLTGYTTTILLIAGLVGLTLVMLLVTILVARVYRHKLIRRLTHQQPPETRETTDTRNGPSMQRIGDRRFYVMSDPQINLGNMFEAPPTYDDALKHPTVPPQSVYSTAFDNPGFANDSQNNGGGPSTSQSHSNTAIESDSESCTSAGSAPPAQQRSRGSLSSSSISTAPAVAESTDNDSNRSRTSSIGRTGLPGIIQWAKDKVQGSRRGSRDKSDSEDNETNVDEETVPVSQDALNTTVDSEAPLTNKL